MEKGNIEVREELYRVAVRFTEVTEYGISLEALLSQQVAPPAEGARFDVWFEGTMTGERLSGSIQGCDYLRIRADGHADLHIRGCVTTPDGANVAFFADGVGLGDEQSGLMQLRENVRLTTAHPEYAWVNALAIWGVGTVDPAKGEVNVVAYSV